MPEKNWKLAERRVAKFLGYGAKRVPVTGRGRGDAPDITHPFLSIEHKYRQDIPKWIEELSGISVKEKSSLVGGVVITTLAHFMEFIHAIHGDSRDPLSVLYDADYPVRLERDLPEWIIDAIDQAVKSKRGNQCPVVIISKAGRACNRSVILVDKEDAKELIILLRKNRDDQGVGSVTPNKGYDSSDSSYYV